MATFVFAVAHLRPADKNNVPLVYLSVRLMPDIHPSSVTLDPAMMLTLLFWFAPVTLLTIGLIATRFLAQRRANAGPGDHASGIYPTLGNVGGVS